MGLTQSLTKVIKMNCDPYQPIDPCEEPCPLEKLPKGLLAPSATKIYNDNIDRINCILCPETSLEASPDDPGQGVLVIDLSANDINPEGTPLGPVTSLGDQPVTPGGSVTVPEGTLQLGADGVTVTFVPGPGYDGSPVVYNYVLTDSDGDDSPSTVTFTIAPPTTEDIDIGSISAGGILSGDLAGVSTPGDDPNLTYAIDTADPKSSTITLNLDGTFSVDTTGLSVQTCSVEYTITDGNGLTSTSTINWEVIPNTVVAADDGPVDAFQGQPVVIDFLGNDSDPEGDTFTISAKDGQPMSAVGDTVTTANGVWELVAGPQLQFTPNTDAPVGAAVEVCTYEITDSGGNTDTADITVNIAEVPCPVATFDSVTPNKPAYTYNLNVAIADSDGTETLCFIAADGVDITSQVAAAGAVADGDAVSVNLEAVYQSDVGLQDITMQVKSTNPNCTVVGEVVLVKIPPSGRVTAANVQGVPANGQTADATIDGITIGTITLDANANNTGILNTIVDEFAVVGNPTNINWELICDYDSAVVSISDLDGVSAVRDSVEVLNVSNIGDNLTVSNLTPSMSSTGTNPIALFTEDDTNENPSPVLVNTGTTSHIRVTHIMVEGSGTVGNGYLRSVLDLRCE